MNRAGNSSTGSQACAACKYQRRKCAPNCPLAPYFPPHHQKDFLNAHKLFGVSNITKIIRHLQQDQKPIAMRSIIFQANARANDPVGGCHRIICELQRHIQLVKAELDLVLHQLAMCRAQEQVTQDQGIDVYDAIPVPSMDYCYHDQKQEQEDGFGNLFDGGSVKVELDISSSQAAALVDVGVFDESETVPFDSKHFIQCSDNKIMVKDVESIQYEQKHDLKDAASLFTLTNSKR